MQHAGRKAWLQRALSRTKRPLHFRGESKMPTDAIAGHPTRNRKNQSACSAFIAYSDPMLDDKGASVMNTDQAYETDDDRWGGVQARDAAADGQTSAAARRAALVARACHVIEASETPPLLRALAKEVGLSPFHFHRVFKAETGLTPKAYGVAWRARKLRGELSSADVSITDALYKAGFNTSSRFYAVSEHLLGMRARDYRAGGSGCGFYRDLFDGTASTFGYTGYGVSRARLARAARDSTRHHSELGGDRRTHWFAQGSASRRASVRNEPHCRGHSLPPGRAAR